MRDATGEAGSGGLRVTFDRRLKLEFHRSTVTSDAGLLAFRELDDALGLTEMAGEVLTDIRTGKNGRHSLIAPEGFHYAILLPANRVLQARISHLLKRPVGRPPRDVRRSYASSRYQAQSWYRPRRVVAKVEWHPRELYPRVGFLVTNLRRPARKVVAFYNGRGTAEQ